MYRAEAEYKLRDYEASIHTYDLLLEMEPSTASYLYAQSMCYSQMGDTENAVAKYQAGAALEKDAKASAGKMERWWRQAGHMWMQKNTKRPWAFTRMH